MFKKVILPASFLATFLLYLLTAIICTADEKSSPKIFADSYRFEFGEVEESTQLKHTFKISNGGTAPLLLNGAESSCGCTVPTLNAKTLAPRESTDLLVIIDTAMKQGRITKTVSVLSNDPTTPSLKLYLSMEVKNPHIGLSDEGRAKIFTSDHCNSCHVAKGAGLFGKDLYEADCAMCHGKLGIGAVGPQLLGPYESAAFKAGMKTIASYGSPSHRSMPGFLVDAGGPLSKGQIDSIMNYLGEVSKQRYYPGKVMPK